MSEGAAPSGFELFPHAHLEQALQFAAFPRPKNNKEN